MEIRRFHHAQSDRSGSYGKPGIADVALPAKAAFDMSAILEVIDELYAPRNAGQSLRNEDGTRATWMIFESAGHWPLFAGFVEASTVSTESLRSLAHLPPAVRSA